MASEYGQFPGLVLSNLAFFWECGKLPKGMPAEFLRADPNDGLPALGRHNLVLRASARVHHVKDYPGPLSIKTVVTGQAAWRHNRRSLAVAQDSFLVLSDGEPYSLDIEAREPVHTCCVFFAKGFVESVHQSMTSGSLDRCEPIQTEFLSHLHPRHERILTRVSGIAGRSHPPGFWMDEQFLGLAEDLLLLYANVKHRISRLPGRKPSTREELYRRVSTGRDFIHARAFENINLGDVARASLLSPYHFHRAFRGAFGVSPHDYVTRLRIDRAAQLLRESPDLSVTQVAGTVGFESPTSFADLFSRYTGVSPSTLKRGSAASKQLKPADAAARNNGS
jgi:AraC family transcriptional regulator